MPDLTGFKITGEVEPGVQLNLKLTADLADMLDEMGTAWTPAGRPAPHRAEVMRACIRLMYAMYKEQVERKKRDEADAALLDRMRREENEDMAPAPPPPLPKETVCLNCVGLPRGVMYRCKVCNTGLADHPDATHLYCSNMADEYDSKTVHDRLSEVIDKATDLPEEAPAESKKKRTRKKAKA